MRVFLHLSTTTRDQCFTSVVANVVVGIKVEQVESLDHVLVPDLAVVGIVECVVEHFGGDVLEDRLDLHHKALCLHIRDGILTLGECMIDVNEVSAC